MKISEKENMTSILEKERGVFRKQIVVDREVGGCLKRPKKQTSYMNAPLSLYKNFGGVEIKTFLSFHFLLLGENFRKTNYNVLILYIDRPQ